MASLILEQTVAKNATVKESMRKFLIALAAVAKD
jgi:hypothetical protein